MRDIPAAAKTLRENLRAKYSSYFDQHGVYFALQTKIEEKMAKDVFTFVDSFTLEELTAFADVWGLDGLAEADED